LSKGIRCEPWRNRKHRQHSITERVTWGHLANQQTFAETIELVLEWMLLPEVVCRRNLFDGSWYE
jgi:hypothetical protein